MIDMPNDNLQNIGVPTDERKSHITLAIIAHDGKKADMVAWATFNRGTLSRYNLVATGTTGKLLQEKVGLKVERLASGPYGGDAQIAARVVEGSIDCVFFFVDPLDKHPHDPDIQALLRVCNVHNVPIATNIATADLIISSNVLLCKHGLDATCEVA
jgi:methylglyoxal synthase